MEFRGIRQTSIIEGVNRNPASGEDNKVLVWNNSTGFFEYKSYWGGAFNTKTLDGIVNKGDDSSAPDYVWKLDSNNNPFWRKEDFLVSAQRSGNSATFVMNDSDTKTLPLGALAWLDSIPADLLLPGNTKVLFDDNDTIGGDSSFTFDKVNKYLDLTAFTAIRVKNGVDVSRKGVLQYLGGKNILLGHGTVRPISWAANMTGNTLIGEQAGGLLNTGNWNTLIGPYAGQNIASNVSGMVGIGPYAGRLETDSDKFYLGNSNESSLSNFRNNSLMYGDFSEGWLRINNRLDLPEEIRIGAFDVANTPIGGMVQFVDAGGSLLKPQYFDNVDWQDFANSLNYYLSDVTKATADVGTTDSAYQLTFDMAGISDITLQLGSNAFNSDIIPQASVDLTSGLIQISSGDNSDGNRGFTSATGLFWDTINDEFNVPGGVKLETTSRYTTTGNVIIGDGTHYYGKIGADWVQLDNEPTSGQANEIRYDGSAYAHNISLDKDGAYLPIKGIRTIDDRIVIDDSLIENDLNFSLSLDISGSNNTVATSTLTYANIYDSVTDGAGESPVIKFRPLISSDNSVQFTITINGEIDVSVTGTGNPNTYTLTNEGTGFNLKDTSLSGLTDWKLKSILEGTHISISEDTLDLTINVDDLTLNNSGDDFYPLAVTGFAITQKQFIDGVATEVLDDSGLSYNVSVPMIGLLPTPSTSPSFTAGGTAGQGTLDFKANYSADIRTDPTLVATTLHTINIGSGLFYNSTTKTLSSLAGEGSTTDYSLVEITRVGTTSELTFNVTDSMGAGSPMPVSYTFGALAFLDDIELPMATYTDNGTPHIGAIMVDKSTLTYPVGTYQPFTLNESTGEISLTIDPVMFDAQYDLHDADNISGDNLKRSIARSNTGSAYVNGDVAEDFNADLLTANQITVDTISDNEFSADVVKLQNIIIRNQRITSSPENYAVYLSKREVVTDQPTGIEVRYGDIAMAVNVDKGGGNVNFHTVTNAGVITRVAYLDSDGTLHCKGDIIAFDTTV